MKNGYFIDSLILFIREYIQLRCKGMSSQAYIFFSVQLTPFIEIFDKSDEKFLQEYQNSYGSEPIDEKRIQQLSDYFDELQIYANHFLELLDFKYVLLCKKAQLRIAELCGMDFESTWFVYMELMEQYGNLYDYEQYLHWCNIALKGAQNADDEPLVFVFLARKWAQCFFGNRRDPDVDFSSYFMNTAEQIVSMCSHYHDDPGQLEKGMKEMEMRKLEELGLSYADEYSLRINLIEQAYEIMLIMLDYNKKDKKSFEKRISQLETITCESLDAIDIKQTFALTDSLRGEKSEENDHIIYHGNKEEATPEQVIPSGISPAGRLFYLAFFARKLLDDGQKERAQIFYEELQQMVDGEVDPFLRAVLLIAKSRFTQEENLNQAIQEKTKALELLEIAESWGCHFAAIYFFFYTVYSERGNLYTKDNPEQAIEDFTKAIDYLRKISMGQYMRISELLCFRGCVLYLLNHREESEKDIAKSFSVIIEDGRRRIPLMDSDTREIYWEKAFMSLRRVMAFVEPDDSPELIKAAYQVVLFSKGLLLTSEQTVKKLIEEDEEFDDLRTVYQELQNEMYGAPVVKKSEKAETVDRATPYFKSLDLVQKLSKVIENHCDYLYDTFDKTKSTLAENQVLVDFFDYELDDGDQQYVAFVITPDAPSPVLIKLCKESDLSKVFNEAKAQNAIYNVYNPRREYAYELTKALWKPIEKLAHMSLDNELLIVPSGSLAKIPIEALPVVDGEYTVLSECFRKIVRLSHARALSKERGGEMNSIALFGGLDYGQGSGYADDTPKSRGYSSSTYFDTPTPLEAWHYLSGTRQEVNTIARWLTTAHKDVKVFDGGNGTAPTFKSLSGKAPDIIHIASHGFFETKNTAVNLPALQTDDPMSLSGLVFANGNEGWLHGTPHNHEGIITAAEIARMRLSSKIVVLSACHSGDGMLRADGVYGIQRGFKKAGVQCLIMSLWMIDDSAMQAFMELFYSKLIGGKDRHTAFFDAKHELMKATPNISWTWAGLIMLD